MFLIAYYVMVFVNFTCICLQDGVADETYSDKEHNYEITESMRLEMEYNSDRAW